MPFHFCLDELLMITAMFPFIGTIFHKIHVWYHLKFEHHDHKRKDYTS